MWENSGLRNSETPRSESNPATRAEPYFFCWVGPKFEAVTEVTSEGFGR